MRDLYANSEMLSSASSGEVMLGSQSNCVCLSLWVLGLGFRYLAVFFFFLVRGGGVGVEG